MIYYASQTKTLTVINIVTHQNINRGKPKICFSPTKTPTHEKIQKFWKYLCFFRPVTPHILEEYEEWEDEINKRRARQLDFERKKVIREHARQIENAKKRIEDQERLRKEVEAEDKAKEEEIKAAELAKKRAAEMLRHKSKQEL